MKNFGRVIRWASMFLYFAIIFYLLTFNEYYSNLFNISIWIIPCLGFISLVIALINYMKIDRNVNVIETEFTSIVNHTFRTPLTKIMWALTDMKNPESSKNTPFNIQTIENSASRVLDIVDLIAGMQDVGNKSTYFFKAISIREVIETSIAKYRKIISEKKFNFQIGTFNDIPLLTGDLKKISFVFDVIMENALSYTDAGGSILVGATRQGNKIIFYIADNGIGLSYIDKMRIFSRFFRSDRARKMYTDGMGLSLYLSKKIIERHQGKIYAKSNGVNKGSTFFVELPL